MRYMNRKIAALTIFFLAFLALLASKSWRKSLHRDSSSGSDIYSHPHQDLESFHDKAKPERSIEQNNNEPQQPGNKANFREQHYFETFEQFQQKVVGYRKATRIVYNRVPKCGSTAVHVTMGKLNKELNYTLHIASIFTEHHVAFKRQQQIIAKMNSLREPWIFDRHVFFINFTAHNQQMPLYINNIRDPIDRIVSWYYFIRFQPMHVRPMSDERKMRTFDSCVQDGLEECTATSNYTQYYNFMYIPFFCGSEDFCLHQTQRALNQAKQNVVKHYAVVGLMDDLPNFFYVLEHLLPQFFTGSVKSYQDNAKSLAKSFKTKKKVPPSDTTRQIMRSLLPLEYDFYYFVKQRFYSILEYVKKLQLDDN